MLLAFVSIKGCFKLFHIVETTELKTTKIENVNSLHNIVWDLNMGLLECKTNKLPLEPYSVKIGFEY